MEEKKNLEKKHNYLEIDPDYKIKDSSASTKVSDIESIVFGGIRSRFWMLRKHFNSMSV